MFEGTPRLARAERQRTLAPQFAGISRLCLRSFGCSSRSSSPFRRWSRLCGAIAPTRPATPASVLPGCFRPRPEPRLGVMEQASVDGKRKLVLIRRDDVEHLIMTGGPVDVVIETGIAAPRQDYAEPEHLRALGAAAAVRAQAPQLRPGRQRVKPAAWAAPKGLRRGDCGAGLACTSGAAKRSGRPITGPWASQNQRMITPHPSASCCCSCWPCR